MSNRKIDTVIKIEDLLQKSGLYWSLTYVPGVDSYCIYIADNEARTLTMPEDSKGDASDD